MTRRDYNLIAACIRDQVMLETNGHQSPLGVEVMQEFARRMASELLNTNPRFNCNQFLYACGVIEKETTNGPTV